MGLSEFSEARSQRQLLVTDDIGSQLKDLLTHVTHPVVVQPETAGVIGLVDQQLKILLSSQTLYGSPLQSEAAFPSSIGTQGPRASVTGNRRSTPSRFLATSNPASLAVFQSFPTLTLCSLEDHRGKKAGLARTIETGSAPRMLPIRDSELVPWVRRRGRDAIAEKMAARATAASQLRPQPQ